MSESEEFFEKYGNEFLQLSDWEMLRGLRVEDVYQHFKERLMAELAVSAPDLRTLGILIEKPDEPDESE